MNSTRWEPLQFQLHDRTATKIMSSCFISVVSYSALLCSAVMTLSDCARGLRSQRTLRVDTPPGKKSGEPPTTSCLTGRTQMVVPSRLNPRPWRDGRDSVPLRRPVWVGRRTCDRAGRAESTPVVITPTFDLPRSTLPRKRP
jgi:hypothetical protein